MYPATLYRHNECLGTFHKVDVVTDASEDRAARARVRIGRLEQLRAFVAFEVHYADGRREEIARGMAG